MSVARWLGMNDSPADHVLRSDYARSDTLFVVLLLSAVSFCTLMPFALL